MLPGSCGKAGSFKICHAILAPPWKDSSQQGMTRTVPVVYVVGQEYRHCQFPVGGPPILAAAHAKTGFPRDFQGANMRSISGARVHSQGAKLASHPQPKAEDSSLGSPYCSDPNCESCRKLRDMQEAIRRGQPVPIEKTHKQ